MLASTWEVWHHMLRTEIHFHLFALRAIRGQKTELRIYLFFFDTTSKLLVVTRLCLLLKSFHSRKDSVGTHAAKMF
jgi:hypothetical protein